jgi:hypothetical protein
VCILIVSCSVFLNWVCWARGNFSGEPGHVHIRVCESPLCGAPGRYEYIWALRWCGWRGCTGFLSSWLCFGVCGMIEQVGVAGQYDFSSCPGFVLAGTVRLKWRGCAVISFSFSLVSCHSSWRVDMCGRDIALFLLWYFVVVSCGFHTWVDDC